MANPHDNTENRSKGAPGQEAGQEESWLQSSSPGSISQPDPHQGLSEAIASGGNPPEIVTSRSPRTVDEDVAEELCGSSQDSSASSSNEPASSPSDRKLTTATLPPAQPEGAENIATESETEQKPSVSVAEPSSPKASQSEASISSREPPPLHPPQSSDEAGGECRYCLRKGRGRTLYSETALIAHERKQHPFPCLQGCVDRDFTTASHRQQHYNSSIHTSSPTIARQYKCGRCGYTTDRRNFHIAHLGRQQACREMAQPAMYECIHHGPTSLDKEEHLSHLEDDRPSTGLFMCGRCGHTTEICYNHLRHLRRQHPCPQMKEPKMYECKTHGPTSLDMEEHITHLRDPSLHWIIVPSTEGEGKIVYNTTETER